MNCEEKPQRQLFALIALAAVLVDQLTKLWAEVRLQTGPDIELLWGRLTLRFVTNTGAAFGVMRDRPDLLLIIAAVAIVFLLWLGLAMGTRARFSAVSLGMILGGAVGNLLDRVCRGSVVDFIDVHFWPQFNVADIAVTVGAIMVGVYVGIALPGPAKVARPAPTPAPEARLRLHGGIGVSRRPLATTDGYAEAYRAPRAFLALRRNVGAVHEPPAPPHDAGWAIRELPLRCGRRTPCIRF